MWAKTKLNLSSLPTKNLITYACPQPYYVEENIKNLDKLIKLSDELEVDPSKRHRLLKMHRVILNKKDFQILQDSYRLCELVLIKKRESMARNFGY